MLEKIDFKKIGHRIKEARIEAGFTQEILAQMCECSTKHIEAVENGRKRASLELLVRISRATNSSIDHLLLDDQHISSGKAFDTELSSKTALLNSISRIELLEIVDILVRIQNSSPHGDGS